MGEKKQFFDTYFRRCYFGRNVDPTFSSGKYRRKIETAFFVFSILTYLLSAVELYCCSVLDNLSLDIRDFLFEELGVLIPMFLIALLLSFFVHLYLTIVVMCACLLLIYNNPLYMSPIHKFFVTFSCVVNVALFLVLGLVWPDNSQWQSIAASFEITGPFLQLCFLVVLVLLFLYLIIMLHKLKNLVLKIILSSVYALILVFFLSIPFWLYSPCIGKTSAALVKPMIYGHKGAPYLAPENTMLSFRKAVQSGVYGLESDVRISQDGVAFLMHDYTLLRTTNVRDVFPSRQHDRPESFTWAELQQLNAGDWFVGTVDRYYLSTDYKKVISRQKIPSFQEWVAFATIHNTSLLFDLFSPPLSHLNYSNYLNGTLQILLDSGIPQSKIIWPVRYAEESVFVRNQAPNVRIRSSEVVKNPSSYHIDIFNLPYQLTTEDTILKYNVSVIEYIVDTSLTFSRAWCQGAWAVTTNRPSLLSPMTKPSWVLTTQEFLGVWISIELIALFSMGLIFYCCYYKKLTQGPNPTQSHHNDQL